MVTMLFTPALPLGDEVAFIAVQVVVVRSYWNALNASYEAELLASRAQIDNRPPVAGGTGA